MAALPTARRVAAVGMRRAGVVGILVEVGTGRVVVVGAGEKPHFSQKTREMGHPSVVVAHTLGILQSCCKRSEGQRRDGAC
jgi:uncharacterized membrane protein